MPTETESLLPDAHDVVLFDGVCNLCNGYVQFIIRRDRKDRFRFAAIQSPIGERLYRASGLEPSDLGSMVLISRGRAFVRSDAAQQIARHLDGPWRALGLLLVVPRFLRDPLYALIARNRYRWFGRRTTCLIPTPALQDRFLERPDR